MGCQCGRVSSKHRGATLTKSRCRVDAGAICFLQTRIILIMGTIDLLSPWGLFYSLIHYCIRRLCPARIPVDAAPGQTVYNAIFSDACPVWKVWVTTEPLRPFGTSMSGHSSNTSSGEWGAGWGRLNYLLICHDTKALISRDRSELVVGSLYLFLHLVGHLYLAMVPEVMTRRSHW